MTEMKTARPRSLAELVRHQVAGVDAWHRARRATEAEALTTESSREARMDLKRRLEVFEAQHAAIVARADRHLSESVRPVSEQAPLRAVVVHRNAWYVGKLTEVLGACGVQVLDHRVNGAEGVGVVVAEQPDLLLVEDVLPMLPGEQVVREARRFSPETLVVAQVAYSDRIAAMLEAGATTAFSRQVPPQDVARQAAGLLTERVAVPGQTSVAGTRERRSTPEVGPRRQEART